MTFRSKVLARTSSSLEKKTLFWIFWPNSAISGARIWPKLSKGTSTGQDLSYEPIPRSLRPFVAKKQPGKLKFRKNRYFGYFGQNSAISGGRIWPKLSKGTSTG